MPEMVGHSNDSVQLKRSVKRVLEYSFGSINQCHITHRKRAYDCQKKRTNTQPKCQERTEKPETPKMKTMSE